MIVQSDVVVVSYCKSKWWLSSNNLYRLTSLEELLIAQTIGSIISSEIMFNTYIPPLAGAYNRTKYFIGSCPLAARSLFCFT